jgi:hypothetical protein
MSKHEMPTQADFDKAKELADELRRTLPPEFKLAARATRDGIHEFPDLHFKVDPTIPGLYFADVDPDFIMARKSRNGHFAVKDPSRTG